MYTHTDTDFWKYSIDPFTNGKTVGCRLHLKCIWNWWLSVIHFKLFLIRMSVPLILAYKMKVSTYCILRHKDPRWHRCHTPYECPGWFHVKWILDFSLLKSQSNTYSTFMIGHVTNAVIMCFHTNRSNLTESSIWKNQLPSEFEVAFSEAKR